MTNNALQDLTVVQLKRAVTIKQRILELEAELQSLLGGSRRSSFGVVARRGQKRRKMSAKAKAKIAAAARARWAKWRAAKGK